jgi:hypothetical protein
VRVSFLENAPPPEFESHSSEIEDLFNKIKEIEVQITAKVDCDMFDNEVASLREMIGNMEPDESNIIKIDKPNLPKPIQTVAQFSTKDVNRIKDLLERFPSIEELLNKLLK